MNAPTAIKTATPETLPALVQRVAAQLAEATTAAEILSAAETAGAIYDLAKRAARLARAKQAHDELVVAAWKTQGDAVEIEVRAKRRLADEYDAAQERGEVARNGQRSSSQAEELATVADIGLTHKQIHEARAMRDAEEADPGCIRRAVDELLADGEEPTRAAVRRKVISQAKPKYRVSDAALWLWGRLRDFDRFGMIERGPHAAVADMTPAMRSDVFRLAPIIRRFLEELEGINELA